jgi:hypothetical protein
MFELSTQPSSIVQEIANVRTTILRKQDDNDTDQRMSEIISEYLE